MTLAARIGLVFALGLAVAGCQPRTEIVIGFATDLKATQDFDSIDLQIVRTIDGVPEPGSPDTWSISGNTEMQYNLPASYGVYSDGEDVNLNVTLQATSANQPVVSQTVTLSLVDDQTLFYRMGLTSECASAAACAAGDTCIEGKCAAALVDVKQLPRYTADLVTTLTCISPIPYIQTADNDPMNVSPDAASCPSDLCVQGLCLNPPGSGGSGLPAGTSYLKASNTAAHADFGTAMAISADGSTLVVGAPGDPNAGSGIDAPTAGTTLNAGGVYVFVASGSAWVQQTYIKADFTSADAFFGSAVALSANGDTLAVGALGDQSQGAGVGCDQTPADQLSSGAVYIYRRTGTTWNLEEFIKADVNTEDDQFGAAVALGSDGNTLAVGSPHESSNATTINGDDTNTLLPSAGAAYVFTRNGRTWEQQAFIKPSNAGSGDQFGTSVALSDLGTTLVVGAQFEQGSGSGITGNPADDTLDGAGAAYVFAYSSTTSMWSQQAYLKSFAPQRSAYFGYALTLSGSGDLLAVGAFNDGSASAGAGAVYTSARSGTSWSTQAALLPSTVSTPGAGNFGAALALSDDGSTLAIASPQGFDDTTSTVDAGAVSTYSLRRRERGRRPRPCTRPIRSTTANSATRSRSPPTATSSPSVRRVIPATRPASMATTAISPRAARARRS